jgi:hypothetical protein
MLDNQPEYVQYCRPRCIGVLRGTLISVTQLAYLASLANRLTIIKVWLYTSGDSTVSHWAKNCHVVISATFVHRSLPRTIEMLGVRSENCSGSSTESRNAKPEQRNRLLTPAPSDHVSSLNNMPSVHPHGTSQQVDVELHDNIR